MKIKCTYGTAAGTGRSAQGIECQDRITTVKGNGVTAMALADGAARKEKSALCAGIAADAAAKRIRDRFDELYASDEETIKKIIIQSVMTELGKTELALISMASTLSFAAVKDHRFLAGNIGHGVIVIRKEGCSVLSGPQEGSFGNETNFITDLDAIDKLQIYKGELQEPFGFMLFSDGACHSLYERDHNKVSPACETLFQWLDEYDEKTVGEALTENISKYFTENTEDDITIALMVSDDSEPEVELTGDTELQTSENVQIQGAESAETEIQKSRTESTNVQQTDSYSPAGPVMVSEKEKGDGNKKARKNWVLALIVIVVAVGICLAISSALSSNRKDPAGEANQEQLMPEDQSAEEEPSTDPNAALDEGTSNIQKPDSNQIGSDSDQQKSGLEMYYPLVTYTASNPDFFSAGEYLVGTDIPEGEYFFHTGEMLKPGSITINDESCLSGELYCMNIQVEEGDVLTSSYPFTASENVNPVKPENGILISGKYKIGKDIQPGEYIAMTIDRGNRGKYYSIRNGKISNDTAFHVSEKVTVPDDGYIVLYNSAIASDEELLRKAAEDWGTGS